MQVLDINEHSTLTISLKHQNTFLVVPIKIEFRVRE